MLSEADFFYLDLKYPMFYYSKHKKLRIFV